jgi:hypothetical protein
MNRIIEKGNRVFKQKNGKSDKKEDKTLIKYYKTLPVKKFKKGILR